MNEDHLAFLKEMLIEALPTKDRDTISRAWETPGFQEAAWAYRIAKIPDLTFEEAKSHPPSCGGYSLRTSKESPKGMRDWLWEVQKHSKGLRTALTHLQMLRWGTSLEVILSTLNTISETAKARRDISEEEKEPRNGHRKNSMGRDLPLEELLLSLAIIVKPIKPRGYKRLVLRMERVINAWAQGRRVVDPARPNGVRGMWLSPEIESLGNHGDRPWRHIQKWINILVEENEGAP